MSTQVLRQEQGSFFKPKRLFKKRGINGFPVGERTEKRATENRQLNKLKISRCEIQLPGICQGHYFLTWAHSKKSRFLVTSKDWQEAARCCVACHDQLDYHMSHAQMKRLICAAIRKRK